MGLFDFIRNQQNDEELCKIRDMIIMSFSDGNVSEDEKAAVVGILAAQGIDIRDYARQLDDIESIRDAYPQTHQKKLDFLLSVVGVMIADGECETDEIIFCNYVAERLGLTEKDIIKVLAIIGLKQDTDEARWYSISYMANRPKEWGPLD